MKHTLLLLTLVSGLSIETHGAAFRVGGFSTTRAGDSSIVQGPYTQELRGSLVGGFPGSTFVGLDAITPAALTGIDLVVVGSPTVSGPGLVLSSSEQTALLDFIRAGHRAIIYIDNQDFAGGPNESFLDPFGMHSTGKVANRADATSIAPNHPVMNGQFGIVTTFATSFGGWFDNLGPNAISLATYAVNGQPALAAIAPGALAPGSGGVVFIGDADALVDSAAGGLFRTSDNEKLFLNAVAYVPEPSTASLLLGAAFVLGLRRRS